MKPWHALILALALVAASACDRTTAATPAQAGEQQQVPATPPGTPAVTTTISSIRAAPMPSAEGQ